MERGSKVDADIEFQEQQALELERCKEASYWYYNYWLLANPQASESAKHLARKAMDDSYGIIVQRPRRYGFTQFNKELNAKHN